MCGIAGSINFDISIDKVIAKMGHRGPDASGSFSDGAVQFFHLRLAILDIAGGAQPMSFMDRYTIIFNGEIYNHLEVRKALGLKCHSNSDTETILAAFSKVGMDCVNHFDGMFAFCIYDKKEGIIYIARDRAGKKPIYWYQKNDAFVFASELNLLRALLPLQINETAFSSYLKFGTGWVGQTPYLDVYELEPAHWLVYNIRKSSIHKSKWWEIGKYYQQIQHSITEKNAIEKTESILKKGIERRLESSDLEVGCFLSGGIDSGLITSMAAQLKPGLRTFTVSFDGAFDEGPLAKLVAEKYATKHTEIQISLSGLQNDIEKILAQYGEPFYDSSAIPSWYVSKAAKEHLTVILNGDGADELFAGYRRHALFSKYNFFKTPPTIRSVSKILEKFMPYADNKKSYYNYLYRLIFLASRKGLDVFRAAGSDIFEGYEQHFLIQEDKYTDSLNEVAIKLKNHSGTGLQQLLELDFNITLGCDFLVKMDIATMAHSLEGRSPFLCHEMMEFAPTLPDHLKIRGKTTKYLLRKLAKNYLPETLLNQPKRGFEVPLKNWVNHDLKEIIFDYLTTENQFFSTLVQKAYVERLLNNSIAISEEKRAKQLYTLFCIEVWHKKCFIG